LKINRDGELRRPRSNPTPEVMATRAANAAKPFTGSIMLNAMQRIALERESAAANALEESAAGAKLAAMSATGGASTGKFQRKKKDLMKIKVAPKKKGDKAKKAAAKKAAKK
jgi:4-diphosphocytidyl-2C-methyl-D-erythritol kinase